MNYESLSNFQLKVYLIASPTYALFTESSSYPYKMHLPLLTRLIWLSTDWKRLEEVYNIKS